MQHYECALIRLCVHVQTLVFHLPQFQDNILILRCPQDSLLIYQGEYTHAHTLLYQLNDILVVRRGDSFQLVPESILFQLFNLALEDVFCVKFLEFFISEVDAELLETVVVEHLEPENVQDSNAGVLLLLSPEPLVNLVHQVVEHSPVQGFG